VSAYSSYGPFYDATQDTPDGRAYLYLLEQHHPAAKTLLELGCGTGAHLATLANRYTIAGLDISPTMLKYARERLPDVPLYQQDMAEFSVPSCFDAVIIPYDSINHLGDFENWCRTFESAKKHLDADGAFLFDVNTEFRLRELVAQPGWVRRFDEHFMIMEVKSAGESLTAWDIKIFEHQKDTTYRLHHDVIQEAAFDHERIMAALRERFREVRAYDINGWVEPTETSRRVFYVCRTAV
jgi:cyclopropane fatty-acyl-phospholipid synthase-like methyltransferase